MFNSIRISLSYIFLVFVCSCEYFGQNNSETVNQDDSLLYKNNARPIIENIEVGFSSETQMINLKYDVHDDEEKNVNIAILYSQDAGKSFMSFEEAPQGDVGDGVAVGLGREIQIPYVFKSTGKIRIALSAHDNVPQSVRKVIDRVDTVSLKGYVKEVYGIRSFLTDTVHLSYTKSVIRDTLTSYGYEMRTQHFGFKGYHGENIIARKTGYNRDAKKLVICAHFDSTTDSPGADDNASGVAGILEIARVLADIPMENTIEIVAMDMEEVGLVGSKNYVGELLNNDESILGAINLDMIGYMSEEKNSQKVPAEIALALPRIKKQMEENDFVGDFVVCVANEKSKALRDEFLESRERFVPHRKIISILVPGNGELLPDLRFSDHTAFWDQGYPAIFIGDGADSRNPNYHSAKDQIQLLQYGFMKDIVQTTLALALQKGGALHGMVAWKDVDLQAMN